jgi:hypothetical protein
MDRSRRFNEPVSLSSIFALEKGKWREIFTISLIQLAASPVNVRSLISPANLNFLGF